MHASGIQVQSEWEGAAREVAANPEIRAVVLYGGERIFAAGADVKEMADNDDPTMAVIGQTMHAAFAAIAGLPTAVVAAVTGYALGGGIELSLCAEFSGVR